MLAIYKRELKSLLHNIIGWIYLAVLICTFGFFFYAYNLRAGYVYLSYPISWMCIISIPAISILTMRALSEERRNKTDQLILTSPVTVGKMVVAKFLSISTIFVIPVLVMCIAPLIMLIFGEVPLPEVYLTVFSYFLYGEACIAIGVFASSLTESQIISAIVTFLLLFLGYMMQSITSILFSSSNIITKILGCYDLISPMETFADGILDITGVIYYISLCAIFLFLATQVIQKRRWTATKAQWKMGVFSSGVVAASVVAVVIANLAVRALPATITDIDLTDEQLFTLTDDTLELLDSLDEDVTIYVYSKESSADSLVANTLAQYEGASSHITVEYVNPSVSPQFYQNYVEDTTYVSSGMIFVESEKRSTYIAAEDLYEYTLAEDSTSYYGYSYEETGYDGEGQITSAIQYVTMDDMPVIYTVSGHGESDLDDGFTELIEKANITVESLTLLEVDSVPEDAAALIINGPTVDFSSDDADKIIEYLNAGGKLIISTAVVSEDTDLTNFKSILSYMELSITDGIVVEDSSENLQYYQLQYYLLPTIESDTLTSNVSDGYILAPTAYGIIVPEETSEDISITSLLTTSDSAFAKTLSGFNSTTSNVISKEEGDEDGPFAIAVSAEKTIDDDTTAQMIVFSSQMMLTDSVDSYVYENNSTLFIDCVNALVDTDVTTIVVAVKEYTNETLTVATGYSVAIRLVMMILIPVALLIAGVTIWVVRRKK